MSNIDLILIGIEIILFLIIYAVNLPQKNRYRQSIVSVAYLILTFISFSIYLDLKTFGTQYVLLLERYDWYFYLQEFYNTTIKPALEAFLGTENIQKYLWVILDIGLLFLFLVLKLILLFTLLFLGSFITLGSSTFYMQSENGNYTIKEKYIFISSTLLYVSVIGLLALAYSTQYTFIHLLSPIVILLLEFSRYLDGLQQNESGINITENEASSKQIKLYDELFEEYKNIFNNKLLYANSIQSKNTLQIDNKITDKYDPFLEKFATLLSKQSITLIPEFLIGLDKIIKAFKGDHKQNIIFTNTNERSFFNYLKILLEFAFLQNKNIIVLVSSIDEKEQAIKWLNSIVSEEIYNVETINSYLALETNDRKRMHILIDTVEQFNLDLEHLEKLQLYSFLITLNLDELLHCKSIALNEFLTFYNDKVGNYPYMINLSPSSSNIEESFHQTITSDHDNLEEIFIPSQHKIKEYILVLKSEEKKFQEYFDELGLQEYFGEEIVLGYSAWMKGINPILIITQRSALDEELEAIRKKKPNFQLSESLDTLDNTLDRYETPQFANITKNHEVIFTDDLFNLPQSINKWKAQLNSSIMFLTIVSPPYMLRNYLVDNLDFFLVKQYLSEVFPKGIITNKEQAHYLMNRLIEGFVPSESISIPNTNSLSKSKIVNFINNALKEQLSVEHIKVVKKEIVVNNQFLIKDYYTINQALHHQQNCHHKLIDKNLNLIGYIHDNEVYHRYLENMYLFRMGKRYKILQINQNTKEIHVEFVQTNRVKYYHIHKIFNIKNKGEDLFSNNLTRSDVNIKIGLKNFDYSINFIKHIAYSNYREFEEYHLNKPIETCYLNKSVGFISIKTKKDIDEKVRYTFTFLLQEMLKSFLPKTYYLVDFVVVGEKQSQSIYPMISDEVYKKNEIFIYVFESTYVSMNLLKTVLDLENFEQIIVLLDDFLNWYNPSHNQDCILEEYLGTNIKELVDIEKTRLLLKSLLNDNNPLTTEKKKFYESSNDDHVINTQLCDLCSAHLPQSQFEILDDGRKRCSNCKSESVEEADNLTYTDLVYKAKGYLEKRYRIEITENISVEIVNAQQLAEFQGKTFMPVSGVNPRAVGLAVMDEKGNKKILIENGAPIFRIMATMVHELTHIWQFTNLDFAKMDNDLIKIEGQAQWVELTYVEENYPQKKEYIEMEKSRTDEYGLGYVYVEELLKKHSISQSFIDRWVNKKLSNPFAIYLERFKK